MSMHEFIERNADAIVDDWEAFARRMHPTANRQGLQDFAKELLQAIAADMATSRVPEGQPTAAHRRLLDKPLNVTRVARNHAAERLAEGFTLNQLVAEYRLLREGVTRRWRDQLDGTGSGELDALARFDESVDRALAESVGWYFERLENARDLLNAVLAHDLRNPLGSILVSLEFLLMADLDSPYIKAASHIRRSAKRMEAMITEILDFTRTRLGSGLPVAPGDSDLARVCRAIVDELSAFHPDAELHLELVGDLTGRWDECRMEQLLSNLISNAIQHGRRGGPVTVSARGDDADVVLIIHNEGTPILASRLRSIFDPLQSTVFRDASHADRSAGGLGLGLYICREIAHGHGGVIDVSSDASGTTFTVRVPRQPPALQAPPE